MSNFSGKCDLYDHISMEKMYDKGSYKASDELECFELFKKRTGGVIYQHQKVLVSEWNQEQVKANCNNFDYKEITKKVKDSRCKSGEKEIKSYIYTYYDEEYENLKELNKRGVYVRIEIHFNTLLDIIPYYPYIVSLCASSEGKETIYISKDSEPMMEFKSDLKKGFTFRFPEHENKQLQEHYLEVCKKYFLYKLDERTKQISLINYKPLHNGYYEILLDKPADYMHEPKFIWKDGKAHSHWCSPKISENENYVILVSEQDIEYYLAEDIKNNNVVIEYVETTDFPNEVREND